MKQYLRCLFLLFFLYFSSSCGLGNEGLFAQLPVCSGAGAGLIYSVSGSGSTIYDYDPSLPVSSTNPSANTISFSAGVAGALAVSENLNWPSPSPTFYSYYDSAALHYYTYYNGTSWVHTGHNIGPFVSVCIAGGGAYIYSFDGTDVYQYDGTGNATPLLTISPTIYNHPGIAADCAGNFYILKAYDAGGWLNEYNSNGSLINSWTTSGFPLGDPQGGFTIVGNQVYFTYDSSGSTLVLMIGNLTGTNISFSYNAYPFSTLGNFASCAFGNNIAVANTDTAYYNCGSGQADSLSASGIGPFTWAVLSGPAVLNGAGDSVTVTSTGISTIVLSTSAFAPCGNTDTVTVIPYISPPMLNSNSPACTNGILVFGIGPALGGVSYQWTGPGGFASMSQNATVYNIQLIDSGYYTVRNSINGCVSYDSILVSVVQSPLAPQATHNTPCEGDSLGLAVNNPQAGCTFSWSGPQGFNANAGDTFIIHAQSSNAGNYILTAHLNGCTTPDTTLVTITPTAGPPIIQIAGIPTDTMCIGGSLTLDATASNAGSAPTYQWKKNGANIIGATNAIYTTSALSNGDIMSCEVRGNAVCQPIDTTISNGLYIHVVQLSPPIISVTVYPPVYVSGDLVTFSGHVPAGSTDLSFQWMKNGVDIPNATQSTYSSTNVSLNDTICLIVYDHLQCTAPDSVIACVELTNGVTTPPTPLHTWRGEVWPNPVTSVLHIEANEDVHVTILSVDGKVLIRDCFVPRNDAIGVNVEVLPSGVYLLEITNSDGERVIKKIVKE